jgi:hypothetical protein
MAVVVGARPIPAASPRAALAASVAAVVRLATIQARSLKPAARAACTARAVVLPLARPRRTSLSVVLAGLARAVAALRAGLQAQPQSQAQAAAAKSLCSG